MARCQTRHQGRAAQLHFVAIVQYAIDGMRLSAWRHLRNGRHILLHHHDLSAGRLFDACVAVHVIAVRVAAQQDLDICEFEAQFLHRRLDLRHSIVEIAVDQDVTIGRRDQVRPQIVRAHVIYVAHDLESRKRLVESGVILRQQRNRGE